MHCPVPTSSLGRSYHTHLSAIILSPAVSSVHGLIDRYPSGQLFTMIAFGTLQNIYTVAKQVYDVVQSIKNVPEAIRDRERQVLLVQGVLEPLRFDQERREDPELIDWSTEPCLKMLERAHELLEESEKFLQQATREKEDGSKKVNKFKWLLSAQSDAKVLAGKFHECYGPVCTVQSLIQLQ